MRSPALLSTALFVLVASPLVRAQDTPPSTPSTAPEKVALPAGVSLPRTGTAYAVDLSGGSPSFIQLHPSEIVSNSHATGNFARSFVYAGAHSSVELKGINAVVSLKDTQPGFLVRINGDDPELMRSRVHLIHLEQGHDRRVVSTYTQNVFGGQRAKHYDDIDIAKKDADPDVWLLVTPMVPLAPGEYGVVFMPKDTNLAPDAVYDFSIAGQVPKP